MSSLIDLPNIGNHAAQQLLQVGIETPEALLSMGAEQAWLAMQTIDPGVCLHQLYALEGAVQGIPKAQISAARKQELKAFAAAHRPA